jgi:tellurite resistance protein
MLPLKLPPDQAMLALRAARAVALADDNEDPHERAFLQAAARALHLETDVDDLEVISPAELAGAITDPGERQRLVQALIIMALVDGDLSQHELSVVREFAAALDVDEPRLRNLKQFIAGHLQLIRLDMNRRSEMLSTVLKEAWRREGVSGIWTTLAPFRGLAHDPELAWRYKQLGLLPEGTLGRAYWAHMTARRFAFPGEHHGFPELLVKHDIAHVLGGYDTDPPGECQVVSFISGFMKTDPFGYLMMVVMHVHLGVFVFEDTPLSTMSFNPEREVLAYRRGTLVNRDIYDPSIDWWSYFERPIDEVRAELNILPEDQVLAS